MKTIRGILFGALFSVLGCWAPLGVMLAQEKPAPKPAAVEAAKPAPVLSELDALKIENALLKINKAQTDLEALKTAFQSLLTTLQKPDYVIAQGADGKLAYQPEPKKEPETKK